MTRKAGRHFLQIPGPTPVPDRILHAIAMPAIDHRGPAFAELGLRVLAGLKTICGTKSEVFIFPGSGTGAWEAALVNCLSPGDSVLMVETGHFAVLWQGMAEKLGLAPQIIETDWRSGAKADLIEERLRADKDHKIKALCIVHSETSTGAISHIDEIRAAMDAAAHPALLMVDTISSLAAVDYRHDEWGVDVTVGGSQKGLMLPPGLSFTAVSAKALEAAKTAELPKYYWSWEDMAGPNKGGLFPYTPGVNLLYGLDEAILMLTEEGLDNVFARHLRLAEATRRAVTGWGLEILCQDAKYYSPVVTAVTMPAGHSADALRKVVLEHFDMSLGAGLSKVADKVFRIGHLGDTNELTIMAALSGVEMGLTLAQVPHAPGGVRAAMDFLLDSAG